MVVEVCLISSPDSSHQLIVLVWLLARIDELLSELKDISSGERLEGLCKHGFYNKLVKAVGEVLKSHVTSLKAGKSALSHFGVVSFVCGNFNTQPVMPHTSRPSSTDCLLSHDSNIQLHKHVNSFKLTTNKFLPSNWWDRAHRLAPITLDGVALEKVDPFNYLSSYLSTTNTGQGPNEIESLIGRARAAFIHLPTCLGSRREIPPPHEVQSLSGGCCEIRPITWM